MRCEREVLNKLHDAISECVAKDTLASNLSHYPNGESLCDKAALHLRTCRGQHEYAYLLNEQLDVPLLTWLMWVHA